MSDLQAFAKKIFAEQPFSQFIGAELAASSSDSATISLLLADHHKQQHGFAHGGVVSYLADNAIAFAGGLALGGNALMVEFKINYVRPAVGIKLIARATTSHAGKRLAVCQCSVYAVNGESETLCALAQGTVVHSN